MEVRPVRDGEGERLRDVRLRALADSPHAFGRTFDEDAARPADDWHRVAGDERVFVADDGEHWRGMAGGLRLDDEVGLLWGMWVEPEARGTGLAERLVDAVAAWAREQGLQRLELQVADKDGRAAHMYRRIGFTDAAAPPDAEHKARLSRPV